DQSRSPDPQKKNVKQTLLIIGILLLGLAAGYFIGETGAVGTNRASSVDKAEANKLNLLRIEDEARIQQLLAEIERLKAELASRPDPDADNPYPNDTPEDVEKLMRDAFADNNIDWLLEVIERLLRMGKPGYPLLRKLMEDIIFKGKFMPAQSDFKINQAYRFMRIFANQERSFIGFLNYLLNEPRSHPYFKQGAMMGGAFYLGSKAPGTEELSETMMRLFMEQQGMGGMMPGMIPGNIGKKMQVFAMAMSGNKEMAGPLMDEFKRTKDKDLQGDIIGALAYLGDPKALPLVQERLDPTKGDFRREIEALGRLGTEEAHETATDFIRAIPDSKRFYRHAGRYVRQGGGAGAVMLMKERIQANPNDPEVGRAIGSLRRYPSKESLDTLNTIATTSTDQQMAERASKAAGEVDRVLRGEMPTVPPPPKK
ncbi:MAG: HEAT repeat domain-containing protein, partial [Planctomycetota bacterium]|nr:HEAT repeat domain-containing protein [Planctomycetota bacterium]